MTQQLYTGKKLSKDDFASFGIKPYVPHDKLINAVQLAQILQHPLLIKGEPGCGKSKLASAIAAELHGTNFRDFYFEWNIKSSSKAQDGLYNINHIQRLRDANLKDGASNLDIIIEKDDRGIYKSSSKYVDMGVIGKAFQCTLTPGLTAPPVVLIDEIDKADIDFPNDLLLELEAMEFCIPEAKDASGRPIVIKANSNLRPIVIITSNDEKPLPAAFLRRCLFHYIDFKEVKLDQIIESHFPELSSETDFVKGALAAFDGWRKKIDEKGISNKTISTSELLDWIKLVLYHNKANTSLAQFDASQKPPYSEALLKDVESIQSFAAAIKNDTN